MVQLCHTVLMYHHIEVYVWFSCATASMELYDGSTEPYRLDFPASRQPRIHVMVQLCHTVLDVGRR